MGACSLSSVTAAWKIPNPIPARPALCFLNSWACRRTKALCLHSLSYRSCSAQSRQGQTLRAFPVLERKTLKGMSMGARGAHLEKKNYVHLFMLKRKGTCKWGLTWFSIWYQGMEKEAQGGLSGRQAEVRHAPSQAPSLFQELLPGVLLLRTRGWFLAGAEETKWLILLLPSALPWSLVPVLQRGGQEREGTVAGRCWGEEQDKEFSASCQQWARSHWVLHHVPEQFKPFSLICLQRTRKPVYPLPIYKSFLYKKEFSPSCSAFCGLHDPSVVFLCRQWVQILIIPVSAQLKYPFPEVALSKVSQPYHIMLNRQNTLSAYIWLSF